MTPVKVLSITFAATSLINLGLFLRLKTLHLRARLLLQDVIDMREEAEGMLIRHLERTIAESEPEDRERLRAIKFLNWMRARDIGRLEQRRRLGYILDWLRGRDGRP